MKQILQNLGSGETLLADVPAPMARDGHLLIRTEASLVSLGTEKMLVAFGQANLLEKARQQPEKVKQVLQKIRTDGLFATVDAVRSKLDQPLPLGYCNAGTVVEVGKGVQGFVIGDRVASNGPHAEIVCVPKNLCCRIPDGVTSESAAFTVVGAIAMQGVRLAGPAVGEVVVVIGLGLIGLLAAQILRANGCRVLGTDFDASKCDLARKLGIEAVNLGDGEDPVSAAEIFSRGRGVDAVLITASTKSSEPVSQAARMCRKRGRIVLIGVTGLELNRAEFYEKELSFQVSCSYGPGRYDPDYEQGGHDYPVGFVRWTEQRNFEAVLDLMAAGSLDPLPLISHRFPIDRALDAYELVAKGSGLGIVLEYGASRPVTGDTGGVIGDNGLVISDKGAVIAGTRIALRSDLPTISPSRRLYEAGGRPPDLPTLRPSDHPTLRPSDHPTGATPVIGLIGAGNFTSSTLLPALAKTGARLHTIVSGSGVTATHLGKKFGFEHAGTNADDVFADPEINTVLITTRHDSHARYVLAALRAGKRVFVEKPLCLNEEELAEIEAVVAGQTTDDRSQTTASGPPISDVRSLTSDVSPQSSVIRHPSSDLGPPSSDVSPPLSAISRQPRSGFLLVGFNRRFAPQVVTMKRLLAARAEPKAMIMTVNAGALPAGHWTLDPAIGGGRIIGEACHFVDLLRHLAGAAIVDASAMYQRVNGTVRPDVASLHLRFADGSTGVVHYLANGSKDFPKERLEVFCGGGVLQLDNFRELRGFGWKGFSKEKLHRQDKGHAAEMAALVRAVADGTGSPIPWDEIAEVHRAVFACGEAGRQMTDGG